MKQRERNNGILKTDGVRQFSVMLVLFYDGFEVLGAIQDYVYCYLPLTTKSKVKDEQNTHRASGPVRREV